MIKSKLFLGGTCGDSKWRDRLVPLIESKIDAFNPVVDDWTPECQVNEIIQRNISDFVLYTITPHMQGIYSIAEVVDDSNKRPQQTILCLLKSEDELEFEKHVQKGLLATASMVATNGGLVFFSLEDVAEYLNSQ